MSVKRIHVVAAVILDAQKNILLARRPQDKHQGGLWEFPGGKVEVNETVAYALTRELQEELAITPLETAPLITVQHDYVDKLVLLDVWWVTAFDGQPRGCEGQPIEWVAVSQLQNYQFPEANIAIVDAIKRVLL